MRNCILWRRIMKRVETKKPHQTISLDPNTGKDPNCKKDYIQIIEFINTTIFHQSNHPQIRNSDFDFFTHPIALPKPNLSFFLEAASKEILRRKIECVIQARKRSVENWPALFFLEKKYRRGKSSDFKNGLFFLVIFLSPSPQPTPFNPTQTHPLSRHSIQIP